MSSDVEKFPPQTALLVMDVQEHIIERYADADLVTRIAHVVQAAREHGVLVVYVVVGFRQGRPEISQRNRTFARLARSGENESMPLSVHPDITPHPDEPVVVKRRIGAFAGSDLEMILRAQEIEALVLAGVTTSGVVLSTLRLAADLDFELTVLADCCADPDEDVQRILLERVFPFQADVLSAADWIARLHARP